MDYWERTGIEKPQQIVVCAACKHGDITLCGARHWDAVMRGQYNAIDINLKASRSKFEQGFIDQFGEFLSREEAMKIVEKNGQPFNAKRNSGNGKDLYSEGLY